jgi:hypothetical protein
MSRYSGTSSKSAFEPPDSAVTESRCGFVRVSGVSACVSRSEDTREDPASSSGFAACLCAPRKCLNSASSTCPCCTEPGACFVLPCRQPPGQAKSWSVRPRQQARARAARAQARAARLCSTDRLTQWAARRVALLACSPALAKDPPFDHILPCCQDFDANSKCKQKFALFGNKRLTYLVINAQNWLTSGF